MVIFTINEVLSGRMFDRKGSIVIQYHQSKAMLECKLGLIKYRLPIELTDDYDIAATSIHLSCSIYQFSLHLNILNKKCFFFLIKRYITKPSNIGNFTTILIGNLKIKVEYLWREMFL